MYAHNPRKRVIQDLKKDWSWSLPVIKSNVVILQLFQALNLFSVQPIFFIIFSTPEIPVNTSAT